jgi:outer membrane protein assembly factor BamB
MPTSRTTFRSLIAAAAVAACAAAHAAGSGPGILADVVVDPNATANLNENGDILAHYATPIADRESVYTEVKGGTYTSIATWETQDWGARRWDWRDGNLVERWTWWSDWKPVPYAQFDVNPQGAGPLWEPAFQPVVVGEFVFVPAAHGGVDRVSRFDGSLVRRVRPFGEDAHVFLVGPPAVADGIVYYTALALAPGQEWDADADDAWLVRIDRTGAVTTLSWKTLPLGAPAADAPCEIRFAPADLPWPPSPGAVAPTIPCGSQRPGVGAAPAVGADGTVYLVSRAHFDQRYGYVVALDAKLKFRWAASLRGRLADGCGVAVPASGPGACRAGAAAGVDPATNAPPAPYVDDTASSSPVALPDGGVLYGANSRYNHAQGHLLKFDGAGNFVAAYGFGWDSTPAIALHDGTYSIVLKENHYDVGSYCNDSDLCPTPRTEATPADPEAYFITRLSPSLAVESQYRNLNTLSCTRGDDGHVTCVDDHPGGFEYCVNVPAIDVDGTVYANSEDGNLYAVSPSGELRARTFLNAADGAAYTPVGIGPDGVVYSQNLGHLLAVAPIGGRRNTCATPASDGARGGVCAAIPPLPQTVGAGR